MNGEAVKPIVSIILPTFNRVGFLAESLQAIRSQTFPFWELIVVDDGSTDATSSFLEQELKNLEQPWKYIYQENRGAYAARNRGLDEVSGEYTAFYDSDDLWLPHHLAKCVKAFTDHPIVDWVYGASRIVDFESGLCLSENCFYPEGLVQDFMNLPCTATGDLNIIHSTGLLDFLLSGGGLFSGLQNSVIRSRFFHNTRFETSFYNEAEDRLIVVRATAEDLTFAYFKDVHIEYRIHTGNSSAAAKGLGTSKKEKIAKGLIKGYEQIPYQLKLNPFSKRKLDRYLADLYMWQLGYNVYWESGNINSARQAYRKAITLNPYKLSFWKTLLASYLKSTATQH